MVGVDSFWYSLTTIASADNDQKNMYDLLVYAGINLHLVGTNQIVRLICNKVTCGFLHFEKLKLKRIKGNAIQAFRIF